MRPESNESKPVKNPAETMGKRHAQTDTGGGVIGSSDHAALDPLSAINQLEVQFGAIKRLHAEVTQRQIEIARQSKEIALQREDLSAARANILRQQEEVKQLRETCLKETEAAEAERKTVQEARLKVEADAEAARSQLETASQLESQCAEQSRELRAAKEDAEKRAAEITRKEKEFSGKDSELSEQTQRIAQLRNELETSLKQFQNDRKGLEEHLAQLKKDQEQIAAELKAGAEARQEIEAQSESLRSQLGAAGELETQCARQAAELRLREADQAKRSVELGTMEKVLEKTREKLNTATSKRAAELDARERRLTEQESQTGGMSDALRAELEQAHARVSQMQRELDAASARCEFAESEDTVQSGDAEHELAGLRALLAEASARDSSRDAEIAQLRQTEAELQNRLAGAENMLAEAKAEPTATVAQPPPPDLGKYEQAIKILSERLKAAQAQNQTLARQLEEAQRNASDVALEEIGPTVGSARNEIRRQRLSKYKSLLSTQARKIVQVQNSLTKRHTAAEQILAQRAKLVVVAKELQRREQLLVTGKARSSTAALMFYAVAMLGVLMALSWGAAVKFAPATYAAHAVIQADFKGKPAAEGNVVAWQQYVESLADDPQLLETAAERLEQRGVAELNTPGALRQELKRSLLIESATPESITVSLRGGRPERAMIVLDTVVTAMVSTANAGRAQRPDGIAAEVARAAQVGDGPVADQRLTYAGGIFGGSSILSLACATLVVKRLGRMKRQHTDEAVDAALDARNWAVTAMPEEDADGKM